MSSGIYAAMAAIMRDVEPICKARRNAQQGFSFRGVDDVYNALHPIMAQHGVVCLPECLSRDAAWRETAKGTALCHVTLRMRYTLTASDGSSVSGVMDGEAMDSGDKATSKAASIALKYFLFQAFLIPTEADNDPDATTHAVAVGASVDILGAPAPAEPPRAAPPKSARPTAPASGTPVCPKCGGAMYDNSARRAEEQAAGKPKPCPAYKCRAGKWNKDTKQHEGCDGVIWPAHGEDDTRKPQAAPQPPPGGSDGAPINYDTAPVAAVKSAIVAGRKRKGLTGAAEWHTWLTENSFPTAGTFSESELRAVARAIDDIPF
ncbi:MAG: ERF superfamily protein [Verrucomicrobia bacterium ADurb.Bin122]|nr:MAG: ERF superfamily protein [Verrucomicrobia bacterium ADurb.Bin122]